MKTKTEKKAKPFLDVKVGDRVQDCDPRVAKGCCVKTVLRVGPLYITVQSIAAKTKVRLDRIHDKPHLKRGYYLVQSIAAKTKVRLDRIHDKPHLKRGYYLVPRTTVEPGPQPCSGCGARVGQGHASDCPNVDRTPMTEE